MMSGYIVNTDSGDVFVPISQLQAFLREMKVRSQVSAQKREEERRELEP